MAETIQTKQCSVCKQIKPLDEFHKRKNSKIGYYAECKACASDRIGKYNKTEKRKIKNRIAVRKYQKSYRPKHKANIKARNVVCYAIKIDKLSPASTYHCRICWNHAEQYHHHRGYEPEHAFDIIPVCISCHCSIHKSMA